MADKKKTPSTTGMSKKMLKRKKPINQNYFLDVGPITENQQLFFDAWSNDKNLFAFGAAGTGKTFIALYLALKDVMDEEKPYEKVYIVRSLVSTREIGFLPGTHEDKSELYQVPYKNMVRNMFHMPDQVSFDSLYENLKHQETISFWSTSFLRGTTLDDAIIIVDESQNLNFHELDSIMTRVGQDSKIVFCGDINQSDLVKTNERNGILDFQRILENMEEFDQVEFGVGDIVRSGLVKSYIIAKMALNL